MKHSILIEELTPIAAKGTINGKQWRGRIVGTTINIGPCRWKFDAYKLALSNGEKIAIGQRIAKIEKQPTIPTQHSRKAL